MSTLVTGEAVELSIQPAALAARALSTIIDFVAYVAVNIGVIVALFWLLLQIQELNGLLLTSVMTIISVSIFVALPMTVELLTHGRSLGKLALGLRVVRDDGGAIRARQALIRAILWQFEVVATGGGIAALSGLVSPQAKRLGDYMAGTVAVSERTRPIPPVQTTVAPHLHNWLAQADIAELPPGLHRRVTQFLATAPNLSRDSRWERSIELATEVNPYVAPAPPEGTLPEQYLSAVIHQRRVAARSKSMHNRGRAESFRGEVDHLPFGLSVR